MQCSIFKNSCIGRLVLINRCFVYLKYIQCAKTCKNVQKRASQVLIDQKTCIWSSHLPKMCKNRAKTCISSVFGSYSKTCIVKVRASWGRVSQGLTVTCFMVFDEELQHHLYSMSTVKVDRMCSVSMIWSWLAD